MPNATPSSLTTIAQFSFLFTSLVTVFGWFVAAKQAEFRELRKEVREHTKSVSERCAKVRESAAAYWISTDGDCALNAISLKADVMSLSRQVQTLAFLGIEVPPRLMADIRTTATGGDFEKKGRVSHLDDEVRILDVANAIEDLLASVDDLFYSKFPASRKSVWKRYVPFAGLVFLSADHP